MVMTGSHDFINLGRKDVLKHIAIDTFIGLDVLDFDLKCLSAERLAVEPHIVEV